MKRFCILAVLLAACSAPAAVLAETVTIPAGTRIFGELQEAVSSDVDEFEVGQIVSGRVWRNVVVDGRTVVSAGAPMTLQVSAIKKRKVFGRAGQVEVRAVSLIAVDGSEIFLDGGYDKKGDNRVVLSSTLAALVAWPTLFIKGKEAVLPSGTVFDAAIPANTNVTVSDERPQTLRLTEFSDLDVEILYDAMQEGDRDLPMRIELCDHAWNEPVEVSAVNEAEIEAIEIEVTGRTTQGNCEVAEASVDLKTLSKHFARGINRFTVRVGDAEEEILLDVEM